MHKIRRPDIIKIHLALPGFPSGRIFREAPHWEQKFEAARFSVLQLGHSKINNLLKSPDPEAPVLNFFPKLNHSNTPRVI